jgi:L-cysteate sulfo-lyase
MEQLGKFPRVRLAHLPTPLEEMSKLSKELNGPKILIKRDDCTGLALGGNKTRKLEFIFGDAIEQGVDVVITEGPLNSNHCCMTAAAAKKVGMKAILVLYGEVPSEITGNLLLDQIFDADIVVMGDRFQRVTYPNRYLEKMDSIAREVKRKGEKPYIIYADAPLGALGYVNAVHELLCQAKSIGTEITYIIHATSGSATTQTGLVIGTEMMNKNIQVIGISASRKKEEITKIVSRLIDETVDHLAVDLKIDKKKIIVNDEYVGEDYEIPTQGMIDAVKLVARTEGILLDPVYTGKAMAGMIDLIKKGFFSKEDTLVFLHTGGIPSIFAHNKLW